VSIEDLEAEIACWQEIFANPEKYSWDGSIYWRTGMLCRTCGASEREHDQFMNHPFVSPVPPYNVNPQVAPDWGVGAAGQIYKKPQVTRVEGIAKFDKALTKMKEVHDKKSADYANDENRYANFEYAAKFAGVTVDQVFAVLIGVKEARLLELQTAGKTAVNESIEDTRLDAAVYAVLRYSYHQ
jgi:hypothetical protein